MIEEWSNWKNNTTPPFFCSCQKSWSNFRHWKVRFLLQDSYRDTYTQRNIIICFFSECWGLCRTDVQVFMNRKFDQLSMLKNSTTIKDKFAEIKCHFQILLKWFWTTVLYVLVMLKSFVIIYITIVSSTSHYMSASKSHSPPIVLPHLCTGHLSSTNSTCVKQVNLLANAICSFCHCRSPACQSRQCPCKLRAGDIIM